MNNPAKNASSAEGLQSKYRKHSFMGKSEYQKYLASREWALLKAKVRERSKGRCERCFDGKYESTHHITYERVGHEKLEDLLGVCNDCHKFLSGKSDIDPLMVSYVREAKLAFEKANEFHSAFLDLYVAAEKLNHSAEDPAGPYGGLYRDIMALNIPLHNVRESLEWVLTEAGEDVEER